MTRVRGILALVLALCALVVTGCAGFATSGPPQYGREVGGTDEDSGSVAFIPNRPQPGASPEQIVEGFIDAGSGPGVRGNWEVAREFLAPSIANEWQPDAVVWVDERAERDYVPTGEGVVDFGYEFVATVDDKGAYQRSDSTTDRKTFRLEKQDDGEWRITEAPDGIWLDRQQFPQVYQRYPLMYFDPTWEYLVPDVRWFPRVKARASIVAALVDKPVSEWLALSVKNAFPDDVDAVPTVPVDDDGVADVTLLGDVLGLSAEVQGRMQTQLEESLRAANVTDVVMSAGSTPIDAAPVAVRSTRVAPAPLVLTEQGFGFLTGDEIDRIPGLSAAVETVKPVSVQVGPDRDLAAVKLASGEVARLTSGGTDAEVLDTRAGLVEPSIDRFGVVWSVPQSDPSALRAYLPTGDQVDVPDAWSEATSIAAMTLSRDGTRVAAVVSAGGRNVLWVAGVIRGDDGVPTGLSDPQELAVVGTTGVGVTWIDDTTIGVLAHGDTDSVVIEQLVSGPTVTTTAAIGMTAISGGTGPSTLRLRAPDGTLYIKRGTAWQPTATGVIVLATQQGAPQ